MGFILALRTINYYFVREAAAGDSRSNVADLSKSELLIETACSLAKKKKKKEAVVRRFPLDFEKKLPVFCLFRGGGEDVILSNS